MRRRRLRRWLRRDGRIYGRKRWEEWENGIERHAYMIPRVGKVYDERYDYYVEQRCQNKKGTDPQTTSQLDDIRTNKDTVNCHRQT